MTEEQRNHFIKECSDAIKSNNLSKNLYRISLQMSIVGLSQDEAYDVIYSAKKVSTKSELFGGNPVFEIIDESICDALDGVVGWCSKDCHIWSPDFDAQSKLEELEKA